MKANFKKHTLQFTIPGGTSRGILKTKDSWILKISDENKFIDCVTKFLFGPKIVFTSLTKKKEEK